MDCGTGSEVIVRVELELAVFISIKLIELLADYPQVHFLRLISTVRLVRHLLDSLADLLLVNLPTLVLDLVERIRNVHVAFTERFDKLMAEICPWM